MTWVRVPWSWASSTGPRTPSSTRARRGTGTPFGQRADQIVKEGADVLDVGAVKAGPGPEVSEAEELDRLIPAVEGLSARFDLPLSADTWRASVAAEAFRAGAVVGNDISGFADPRYLDVAAAAGAAVVATHIRLAPRVPDPEPFYQDLVGEVGAFLDERANRALAAGIPPQRVIVDAGLDLGKTAAQSLELLRASATLAGLGYPLLLSASNKRFLGDILGLDLNEAPRRQRRRPRFGHIARVPGDQGTRRARRLSRPRHPGRDHGGPMSPKQAISAKQQAAADTNAWLVTGEDPALVGEAVAGLIAQLVGASERSLVLEDFSGEEVDVAAVAGACRTPPFLSDRRVVVLREAGRFNFDQLQPLLSYLEQPLPTTKLVVSGGGGPLPAKFVNGFKAASGTVAVSADVSSREAHNWVSQRVAQGPFPWRRPPRL